MLYYERKFKRKGYDLIIGVDEAGRGPLAGPVVAAAVALEEAHFRNRIDDSKKLSFNQRENAFREILLKSIFGIGIINEKVIDEVNILVATSLAMEGAVLALLGKIKTPSSCRIHILVDGNVRLNINYPVTNIIKGDSRSKSIACASILAKVTRDRIMSLYGRIYPQYGFSQHKGYPTEKHKEVIKKLGLSQIHRKSFSSV
ncbi:MAG: ribonuclease HII [Candidatus Omnitrophica bacterium]|nr:ribonuclease HII [Candidatus Omnitrophota bacterium]